MPSSLIVHMCCNVYNNYRMKAEYEKMKETGEGRPYG
jgi:hypothetical protein